ncbi:vWA domain-containing protein [Poseidonocella sedimentorum]|uniref:Ca-activated chloride channel family protein n=1 Tax=Poseidonocella sedimentorum TaxID=871652 RepID=A0A1I6E3I6_9RHOB|nr:vWA domain-containing protein [Poseidonocella sedimentorum]SFR12334.1 Ca-activated chloride channel family protein [Poseidonocella sedimentorum]
MTGLEGLVLLRPEWLAALPLVALLAWLAMRGRRALSGWGAVIAPEFLRFLEGRGQVLRPRGLGIALPFAAVAGLAALALTGPATRQHDAPALRNLDVVFLLVDLSRSMTEGGSLDDVKAAAAQLLGEVGTRPVALGLYGSEAYLVSPPTSDPALLAPTLAVLDGETLPGAGSRTDRALALAQEVLGAANAQAGDVIVLTDGAGLGPEATHLARALDAGGTRVSAVYIAPRAAPYGMPGPDRAALLALTEAGGGRLADAEDSAALSRLIRGGGRPAASGAAASLLFADHGRWLLWPALLPALMLFRRRARG